MLPPGIVLISGLALLPCGSAVTPLTAAVNNLTSLPVVAVNQAPAAVGPAAVAPAAVVVPQSATPATVVTEVPVLKQTEVTEVTEPYISLSAWRLRALQLLQGLTFAGLVKLFCVVSNVVVQVSPFPQVKRWELKGDTGEADSAPYLSIAFGGWHWCFYGFTAWVVTGRGGFLILVQSNFLGALLGTYYVMTFYRQCRNEHSIAGFWKYVSSIGALVFFEFTAMMILPPQRSLFLSGLISAFCGFVGALSLLVTVPTVLKSRSSRSIPAPLVLASLFSGAVWLICGMVLKDPMIIMPNTAYICAASICIGLKLMYPSDAGFADLCVETGSTTQSRHKTIDRDNVAFAMETIGKDYGGCASQCTVYETRGSAKTAGKIPEGDFGPSEPLPLAREMRAADMGGTGCTGGTD